MYSFNFFNFLCIFPYYCCSCYCCCYYYCCCCYCFRWLNFRPAADVAVAVEQEIEIEKNKKRRSQSLFLIDSIALKYFSRSANTFSNVIVQGAKLKYCFEKWVIPGLFFPYYCLSND